MDPEYRKKRTERKSNPGQEKKEQELNALGLEWFKAKEQGNDSAVVRLQEQIFEMVCSIFQQPLVKDSRSGNPVDPSEAVSEIFIHDWQKSPYNPHAGNGATLYQYFNSRMKFRSIDVLEEDMDGPKVRLADSPDGSAGGKEDGGKKRRVLRVESIYRTGPQGEEQNLIDRYDSGEAGKQGGQGGYSAVIHVENIEGQKRALLNETWVGLLVSLLNLRLLLPGKQNNESRVNYFQMFFTDDVKELVSTLETVPEEYYYRERELFQAMKTAFLDFFLAAPCRSISALRLCREKLLGEMVEGAAMEPPGYPLPNSVYRTYLNEQEGMNLHSDGTIVNQRRAYQQFLKDQIG